MKFEIGAMSVGDILDRGVKLLFARLPTIYLINLLVQLPVLVIRLLFPELFFPDIPQPTPHMTEEQAARMLQGVLALLGVLVLVLLLQTLLTLIGTAVTLRVTAGEFVGRHVGMGEAFGFVFRRLGSLLGAMILVGLIVIPGFCLCVPGFIFFTWFVFVAQIVVLERLPGTERFGRSKELSEGYRWRIFGMLMLLLVIEVVVNMFSQTLSLVLPPAEAVKVEGGIKQVVNYNNYVIFVVVAYLVGLLVESYAAVCWTLLYFDLRIRKEGFDLEVAAARQGNLSGPAGGGPDADSTSSPWPDDRAPY